jgi:hypothetical protein
MSTRSSGGPSADGSPASSSRPPRATRWRTSCGSIWRTSAVAPQTRSSGCVNEGRPGGWACLRGNKVEQKGQSLAEAASADLHRVSRWSAGLTATAGEIRPLCNLAHVLGTHRCQVKVHDGQTYSVSASAGLFDAGRNLVGVVAIGRAPHDAPSRMTNLRMAGAGVSWRLNGFGTLTAIHTSSDT